MITENCYVLGTFGSTFHNVCLFNSQSNSNKPGLYHLDFIDKNMKYTKVT